MATFHGNQNVGGVPSAIYREVGQHFTISVEFMVCVYYIYIYSIYVEWSFPWGFCMDFNECEWDNFLYLSG